MLLRGKLRVSRGSPRPPSLSGLDPASFSVRSAIDYAVSLNFIVADLNLEFEKPRIDLMQIGRLFY